MRDCADNREILTPGRGPCVARARHCRGTVTGRVSGAGPRQVFEYLGRYTHRTGISNRRLLALDERGVTFATKDGKTVPAREFTRRREETQARSAWGPWLAQKSIDIVDDSLAIRRLRFAVLRRIPVERHVARAPCATGTPR